MAPVEEEMEAAQAERESDPRLARPTIGTIGYPSAATSINPADGCLFRSDARRHRETILSTPTSATEDDPVHRIDTKC